MRIRKRRGSLCLEHSNVTVVKDAVRRFGRGAGEIMLGFAGRGKDFELTPS